MMGSLLSHPGPCVPTDNRFGEGVPPGEPPSKSSGRGVEGRGDGGTFIFANAVPPSSAAALATTQSQQSKQLMILVFDRNNDGRENSPSRECLFLETRRPAPI
jgi:hypothetical protein